MRPPARKAVTIASNASRALAAVGLFRTGGPGARPIERMNRLGQRMAALRKSGIEVGMRTCRPRLGSVASSGLRERTDSSAQDIVRVERACENRTQQRPGFGDGISAAATRSNVDMSWQKRLFLPTNRGATHSRDTCCPFKMTTSPARRAANRKSRAARAPGRRAIQQKLAFRTWGGRREDAGRKPRFGKAGVAHRARPLHLAHHPVHITLRAQRLLPSLREQSVFVALRGAIREASHADFLVAHFSVQSNHVHLIVEARDNEALSGGVAGLSIRLARAGNAIMLRRGKFWADRYHARPLRKPRDVRNTVVYVITNWRKHIRGAQGPDPCSSAWWFTGWTASPRGPPPFGWSDHEPAPVRSPMSWLARTGWKRWGLVRPNEMPRSH